MTSVLLVSGSWPPQACGVGDYAEVLARELERQGVAVRRFGSGGFGKLYSPDIVGAIRGAACDLVHIQYPTAGYGRSLTPSALARAVRGKPVVVTLHEYASFRWYRRAWFAPFARNCAARIFTTDEERALFRRRFPARNGPDVTIEIASNIPVAPPAARHPGKVCYFGLIAPAKGIEQFLDLCAAAAPVAPVLEFELIGAIPDRHRRYAEEIVGRAGACGAQVSLHLADGEVARRLARAGFAYLPFPDGASAKRGTLAAAIVNGVIAVTRHSRITSDWIRAATVAAQTPREALDAILSLQVDEHRRADLAHHIAHAAARFRWDAIARRHADLYRKLLGVPNTLERGDDADTHPELRQEISSAALCRRAAADEVPDRYRHLS